MKYNVFRGAIICSLIVMTYGLLFHYYLVTPHNWSLVFMWLPIYISPIWGVAGLSLFFGCKKGLEYLKKEE